MNNNLLRRSTPKTAASERQSAIQHLITFFLWAILTGGVALVGFFLADVVFAKTITVGEIAGNVIYLPLIFAVVDIWTSIYHFISFRKLRLDNPNEPLAQLHIWADGPNGERSPLKVMLSFVGLAVFLVVLSLFCSIPR